MDSLVKTHIPFADDGCGNDIWIEVSTGVIKVFYHEYPMEGRADSTCKCTTPQSYKIFS